MSDETETDNPKEGQKEERVDELDVIGALFLKLIKKFFLFYRNFFKSQKYS